MGGRTAYPWLSTPKITVEDRFYINLFSVFRPFGRYIDCFINNIYADSVRQYVIILYCFL